MNRAQTQLIIKDLNKKNCFFSRAKTSRQNLAG